ncbi:MAG: hypothetical protein U0935_16095 [Pirellulales bacterium]
MTTGRTRRATGGRLSPWAALLTGLICASASAQSGMFGHDEESLGSWKGPPVRYSGGRLEQLTGDAAQRPRQVVVRLPQARPNGQGEVVVEPNLDVLENATWVGNASLLRTATWLDDPPGNSAGNGYAEPPEGLPQPRLPPGVDAEELPAPPLLPPGAPVDPIFEEVLEEGPPGMGGRYWWGLVRARPCNMTSGLGRERLPFAPFEIESAQPFSNFRIRTNQIFNREFPDRAGYYWAKIGAAGPKLAERSVDATQLRLLTEAGGPKFSLGTEIPFQWIDPLDNKNHTGIGDLTLTTKLVMVDGDEWQITQLFRTQFNTGSASMGLGVGRIALEPGFVFRYRWSDITYLYADVKYWVPMGGDPVHTGQVLTWGLGCGHLLWESDKLAVIPTFEVVTYSILNGQKTLPPPPLAPPLAVPTDGEDVVNLFPGVRIAQDRGSDLGLFEIGVSGGWAVTNSKLYDGLLRIDVRFSY